jgi:endonuclease/exonuclease/phosphatase family metal-dependent hydrolase
MQFKVLCFNAWCIPEWTRRIVKLPHCEITPNNRHRLERVVKIADEAGCDILALTEIWDDSDRQWLSTLAQSYGYVDNINPLVNGRVTRRIGLAGPGLLLLSKHPLSLTKFCTYEFNGKPYRVDQGDWIAGKGFVLCEVKILGKKLNLVLTHTIASYGNRPVAPHLGGKLNDDNYYHRLLQIKKLVGEIHKLDATVPLIVTGDFNLEPETTGMRFLKHAASLRDAWTGTDKEGFTAIAPPNDKRVDYILYRGNLALDSCQMIMHGNPYELLSDHLGIVASFHFDQDPSPFVGDTEIDQIFTKELQHGKVISRKQIAEHLFQIGVAGGCMFVVSTPALLGLYILVEIVYCACFKFPEYFEFPQGPSQGADFVGRPSKFSEKLTKSPESL